MASSADPKMSSSEDGTTPNLAQAVSDLEAVLSKAQQIAKNATSLLTIVKGLGDMQQDQVFTMRIVSIKDRIALQIDYVELLNYKLNDRKSDAKLEAIRDGQQVKKSNDTTILHMDAASQPRSEEGQGGQAITKHVSDGPSTKSSGLIESATLMQEPDFGATTNIGGAFQPVLQDQIGKQPPFKGNTNNYGIFQPAGQELMGYEDLLEDMTNNYGTFQPAGQGQMGNKHPFTASYTTSAHVAPNNTPSLESLLNWSPSGYGEPDLDFSSINAGGPLTPFNPFIKFAINDGGLLGSPPAGPTYDDGSLSSQPSVGPSPLHLGGLLSPDNPIIGDPSSQSSNKRPATNSPSKTPSKKPYTYGPQPERSMSGNSAIP